MTPGRSLMDNMFARLGYSSAQGIGTLMLFAAIALAPFVFYPVFLMKILCLALFACAFNLLIGYVGLLSFGHAAYFGFGSYVGAWTAKNLGVTAEFAILLGGMTGALMGLVFGWLSIRRSGLYFSMITLALAQMAYFFALQAPFTAGEDGLQNVPRSPLFGVVSTVPDMNAYWMVAGVFVLGFLLIHRVIHSPFGQVLKGIRDNEARTISLGYRVNRYKLLAFVLSAFVAGIAGATKAIVFGLATLTDVHFQTSGSVVLMTLVGGLGTIFGPIVGAAIIAAMQQYFASFAEWVAVIQGLIFVVCVMLFRKGIVGTVAARLKINL